MKLNAILAGLLAAHLTPRAAARRQHFVKKAARQRERLRGQRRAQGGPGIELVEGVWAARAADGRSTVL